MAPAWAEIEADVQRAWGVGAGDVQGLERHRLKYAGPSGTLPAPGLLEDHRQGSAGDDSGRKACVRQRRDEKAAARRAEEVANSPGLLICESIAEDTKHVKFPIKP